MADGGYMHDVTLSVVVVQRNETSIAERNDQLAKIFLNALANFGAALKRFQIAPNVSYHARRERRICARVELEDTYEVGFSPW
jgi:hypothetical protein